MSRKQTGYRLVRAWEVPEGAAPEDVAVQAAGQFLAEIGQYLRLGFTITKRTHVDYDSGYIIADAWLRGPTGYGMHEGANK